MDTRHAGLTFRETMAGAFALGEVDPLRGAAVGESAGTRLTMAATVTIREMDGFIADPEHRGELAGTVAFAPLGGPRPSSAGVFQLFSPSDDPRLTFMVYELAFDANGEKYYLAGKKEVRHDKGLDLWSDTTTLLARLHQGASSEGRVLGAGVLHLSPWGLVRLVPTMRATNASSAAGAVAVLAKFTGFFVKALWRTYVAEPSKE